MCRWCVEYGKGTKWYLNPDNYRRELYESPAHTGSLEMLAGAGKNTFEIAGAGGLDDMCESIFDGDPISIAAESMLRHCGQVIPLEDAFKVVDLTGNRFLLMHCACRRYFGQDDYYSCLFFEPAVDQALRERPWETDSKVIDNKEAKKFLTEMDKNGCVHALFDLGVDVDGKPPIVICNCAYPDCGGFVIRSHYGVTNAPRKAEYVAVVDRKKCLKGCAEECKEYPRCMPRCQFGAMRFSPTQKVMNVAIAECFGCGICRRACPTGALSLRNRLDYPALVDVW